MGYYVPDVFSFVKNADGYTLSGGTISRSFTLSGGNFVVVASASGYTYTFPAQTTTLVGTNAPQTLSSKTLTAPVLGAGTATAGTAPLKFASGTNLTTPEVGAVEYDGTHLYLSNATGTNARTKLYAGQHCYITSDFSTSSLSAVNVTGMALALPASQTWGFRFYLLITTATNGAGCKFALDVPASSTFSAGIAGAGGSTAGFRSEFAAADATLNASAFVAYIGDGVVEIAGTITTAGTAGNLQLMIAKVTSGTVDVNARSHGTAWRMG